MSTHSTLDSLEEFTRLLNMRDYNRYLIELLFKNCPFSIFITDVNGTILVVNYEFSKRCGHNLNEIVGTTPNFLRSGQHTSEFYENMWKTVLSGKIYQDRVINRRKDGSMYEEYVTIIPLFNSSRKVTHFAALNKYIREYASPDSPLTSDIVLDVPVQLELLD